MRLGVSHCQLAAEKMARQLIFGEQISTMETLEVIKN